MTLKNVERKKEKGNLNGCIRRVAIGSSARVAGLKIALRFFGKAADAGDSNPIDHISISEYGKNIRVFDKNSKLKILMVFILFLITLTTPAVSTITSGPDSSQININYYLLDDDDDTKDPVISSSFISNPTLIECFKEGKGDLLNCEFRTGDPVKNVKSISVFMEANATENYRTRISFNKADFNNNWNGSYRFNLDRSRYSFIPSHESGGFM